MKEKIERKINEIIESIISKDPKEITYNEYRILDSKLSAIKYEEEQKIRNKEMAELVGKTFGYGFGTPVHLPESMEEK